MSQALTLVQGPPGTGKTSVALAILTAWVGCFGGGQVRATRRLLVLVLVGVSRSQAGVVVSADARGMREGDIAHGTRDQSSDRVQTHE